MASSRTAGVYEILNTSNGKRYVGSATDFAGRFRTHRCCLLAGKHHSQKLQHAWNKYGGDAFVFARLLICDRANLLMYEQIAIDVLKPEYNVSLVASSCLGVSRSAEFKAKITAANLTLYGSARGIEVRAKISAALKGRKKKPMSDETKAKISESRRGKGTGPRDPEIGRKISKILTGRKLSKEHKEKISRRFLGVQQSPELVAKRVAAVLGKKRPPYKKHSAEANARKSEQLLGNRRSVGHKASDEARANMRAAQTMRRALESAACVVAEAVL